MKKLTIEDIRIGDIITVFERGTGVIHALYSEYYKDCNNIDHDIVFDKGTEHLYECKLNEIMKVERRNSELIFEK